MSLWTPSGEHEVPRPGAAGHQAPRPAAGREADAPPRSGDEPRSSAPSLEDLTPEERAEAEAIAEQMAAVREQLASTPAAVVVANHVMGLYELAAIHLSQDPPAFTEATVAIDAMAAVIDALPGRLGDAEATLRDALSQIRLAFVQLRDPSAGA